MHPIILPRDPLDADLGLVAAVTRAPLELRELALLEDAATGELMEYVLLAPPSA